MADEQRGTAILIHGGWGDPADWTFVQRHLDAAGIRSVAVDLPSMQRGDATLGDDVAAARAAIDAAEQPVVVAGWSYGGDVMGAAAAAPGVARLIWVCSRPTWDGDLAAQDDGWAAFCLSDPHIDVGEDGSTVLDSRWFLEEEAGSTMEPEIRAHLEAHPRRRGAAVRHDLPVEPVWETVPTTIVLGAQDAFNDEHTVAACRARVPDTRVWDVDHFAIFRKPAEVAAVIAESFAAGHR